MPKCLHCGAELDGTKHCENAKGCPWVVCTRGCGAVNELGAQAHHHRTHVEVHPSLWDCA